MMGMLGMRARSERRYRESMLERSFRNTATNAHFRILEDGKSIFYPQGAFGQCGFIISSAEQEMLLRRSRRKYQSGLRILYCLVRLREPILFALGVLMAAGLTQYTIALRSWWAARART